MRCPLCGGPVHESEGGFECEVGHWVDSERMARSAELRLAEAMWMAVQALDNEADVLRALGDAQGQRFADDAEAQARLLREFSRRHSPRVNDPRDGRAPDAE